MMIRLPPIVGVPSFPKWLFGPSSRMVCPIFIWVSFLIRNGPRMKEMNMAVSEAMAMRNVR